MKQRKVDKDDKIKIVDKLGGGLCAAAVRLNIKLIFYFKFQHFVDILLSDFISCLIFR
jgi:hypothetical protein